MAKKKRVELKKNRSKPARDKGWTRGFQQHGYSEEATVSGERVRAKGDLSRKRTIQTDDGATMPKADEKTCLPGRVVCVYGLDNLVQTADGRRFRCKVRQVLKSLSTDERSIVATGDRVWILPIGPSPPAPLPKGEGSNAPSPPAPLPKGEGSNAPSPPAPLPKGEGSNAPSPPAPLPKGEGSNAPSPPAPLPKGEGSNAPSPPAPLPKGEGSNAPSPPAPLPKGEGSTGVGVIERVEPRHGILTRASRGREHVLVANVDQVVIVMALKEPELTVHLIDRYLASAQQGGIEPIICLNKSDLVDPVDYQPIIGFYSQLGIRTLLTSARTGQGVERLRKMLKDRQSVISGQSGVGKSSLLNAIQPELGLRVREVSDVNQKGKHTTTTADLIALNFGGWVVDTPGIRQFALWDMIPEEAEGFFAEFAPYVPLCGFPDCTHTHEERCAIQNAVALRYLSEQRYFSYLGMFNGVPEPSAD